MAVHRVAVDPKTLIKAREKSGYPDVESVYAKMKNPEAAIKRLKAFEAGEKRPTIKQLDDLAERYFVRDCVFFWPHERAMDAIPNIEAIHDFRMGDDRTMTPELIRFLREMLICQELLDEVLEDEDIPDLGWIGSGKNLTPEQAGASLREMIWRNEKVNCEEAVEPDLNEWIKRAETRLGVAVMQLRPHHSHAIKQQISGVALAHERIPAVVLNTSDTRERRLFTLLHELAHLLIQKPGMSKISEGQIPENQAEEQQCNAIAEHALMPEGTVREIWDEKRNPEDNLEAIARKTGASDSACAVRAYHLDLIDGGKMRGLLALYSQSYADRKARERANREQRRADGQAPGFSFPQHIQARERVGYRMTLNSLLAYDEGRISHRELRGIFGVRFYYIGKIGEQVGYNVMRWQPHSIEWAEKHIHD